MRTVGRSASIRWIYRRRRFRNHHEFGRRTCSESSYLLAAAMLAVTLRVAPISCVLAPVLIATADAADRSVIALDRNSAASAISAIISVGQISGPIVVAVTQLQVQSRNA